MTKILARAIPVMVAVCAICVAALLAFPRKGHDRDPSGTAP